MCIKIADTQYTVQSLFNTAFSPLGVTVPYIILQIVGLSTIHIVFAFWRLVFPYHSKYWEKRGILKYCHVATIILCIVLPAVSPITTFITVGYAYVEYLPHLCAPKDDSITFYTLIILSSAMLAIGLPLIWLYTWILIKVDRCILTNTTEASLTENKQLCKNYICSMQNIYYVVINLSIDNILMAYNYIRQHFGKTTSIHESLRLRIIINIYITG